MAQIHPAELSSGASPAQCCLFLAKIQIDSVPVNSTYEPGVPWGASASLSEKGLGWDIIIYGRAPLSAS